ncbi:SubName: Full=Uncharacterized protein {ECO:0000313/EMBL:CCA76426.1} [Serendipita indica DSM 11827]|nr:SubName: Full=Uncharacterized protein {ECO:0000313/EMBL:CCA76426.1} [Serendipita indica DSM 11827]
MVTVNQIVDITPLKHVFMHRFHSASGDWVTELEARRHSLGWQELEIRQVPWRVTCQLLSRCTCLVSLTLTIDWRETPALVKLIPRLAVLEHIVIELVWDTSPHTLVISNEDTKEETRIRTIGLVLDSHTSRMDITTDILLPLLRMSQHLESLRLSNTRLSKLTLTEIDKLKRLQKLVFNGCEYELASNETRHILASPNLEIVELRGSIDIFESLGSTTASELYCELMPSTTENIPEAIKVSEQEWPSLSVFSLGTGATTKVYDIGLVNSLERLTLSSRSIATATIHYLAIHPTELPLLDTLELYTCPEWDILFIMLEKRLLVQTSNVKSIERITFNRDPPPTIKQPLARLLAGHIVSRPSNYELSMLGNLDAFLDADL